MATDMNMFSHIRSYSKQATHIAPLVLFRIVFSVMIVAGIFRFWLNGWIEKLYITPAFHFSYFGFEWVKPIGSYTYLLFAVCAVSAILVAIGLFYRIAAVLMFLSFTYIELMDKATYLNHYYFVSLVSFLLILLPANASFSLDAWRRSVTYSYVPRFTVDVLRVLTAIVYVYAGVAKINTDWLLEAQPLLTWLPAKNDLPIVGSLFNEKWVAYLFSWFACFYDLTIPLWLSIRNTRIAAFVAVVVFHVLTAVLFPIGMFPYIMIVSALLFFPAPFHQKIIDVLASFFNGRKVSEHPALTFSYAKQRGRMLQLVLVMFVLAQLVFPFRHTLYPGELFWTEQGYRFSWRVMLMEKTGYAVFIVRDAATAKTEMVENGRFLTALQEKQMSFQPDMILEFSHYLATVYRSKGWKEPQVFVDNYVSLNGRPSRHFIDSSVNLAAEKESFQHKTWVTPFADEIKGF